LSKPRNKFETRIYKQLRQSRVSFDYESERIPYIIASHYIPDFIVHTPLGKIYIECKGYLRPEDKRKLVAVKKLNPHMDLRILFYSANKKNLTWADRQGFKYAIDTIPKEWLHGLS
jgi:hypothetical protein